MDEKPYGLITPLIPSWQCPSVAQKKNIGSVSLTSIENSPDALFIVPEKKPVESVTAWQGALNVDFATEWPAVTNLNVTNSPGLAVIVLGTNLRPP